VLASIRKMRSAPAPASEADPAGAETKA
jgi:hypothetical protein